MTQLVENTIALCKFAKTTEDAAKAISAKYPKLSKKEAGNVAQDLKDFVDKKMGVSELDHWLKERGL